MRYKYLALDAQGQEITGILTAENERDATRQLQKRSLTLLTLAALETNKTTAPAKVGKPRQRDVLVALHELTTLLEAGVTLIDTILSLAESTHHPAITQAFADIGLQLRQGKPFSVALQNAPFQLPWYVYQLVEAGELTGKVATALRHALDQMEYEARIRADMRSAMIYPSILIVSGIAAVLFIFILVVPRFAGILKNRDMTEVPFLARAVLDSGMFLNNHLEIMMIGVAIVVIAAIYGFNQPIFRQRFTDFLARLPLIGTWLIDAETARWSAMMSTLLENRVPLMRALELAARGVQLPHLQARLGQVSKAVRAGVSLSQALQDNDALNPTGHNLIRAGEKAGELPRMLRSLATLLEESGRTRMKRFLLLLEPIAILTISAVIGVIITGVILAITSVNQINF